MAWIGGAIAAGGSLLGGMMGSDAAENAANMQAGASDRAIAAQQAQYDQTRSDLAPWREVGGRAITTLGGMLNENGLLKPFQANSMNMDPGYQFRLGEGNKAIENAARARGINNSGATMKDLLRYGQDFASGEYQNAFNRDASTKQSNFNFLNGAAGGGMSAANTVANAGTNMANNIGNLVTGTANARGAAGIAGANSWNNAISSIGNNYNQTQMLKTLMGGSYPRYGAGANAYPNANGQGNYDYFYE